MTASVELVVEEEEDSMDLIDFYRELESLERRVIVQSHHIQ
jgi:hypothetical protein